MFTVVLIEPEIPPNTGNIGRLTLACNAQLCIVGEPSFDLDRDTALKRAGLDYWPDVNPTCYDDWDDYIGATDSPRYLATKFASTRYDRVDYEPGSHLLFGGETRGVPPDVHEHPGVKRVCLPMLDTVRSFNVCNTVAVTLFEALRQNQPDWFARTPYSGESPNHPGFDES